MVRDLARGQFEVVVAVVCDRLAVLIPLRGADLVLGHARKADLGQQ